MNNLIRFLVRSHFSSCYNCCFSECWGYSTICWSDDDLNRGSRRLFGPVSFFLLKFSGFSRMFQFCTEFVPWRSEYYVSFLFSAWGWHFWALNYWVPHRTNWGRSASNEGTGEGLRASFHSLMKDEGSVRTGMSASSSSMSYFVRKSFDVLRTDISWCITNQK
jgi:hypothetical protein